LKSPNPLSLPAVLLRLEGLTVLLSAIIFYFSQDGNWIIFVLLVLAPDLGMLGYLMNTRIGAVIYDIIHTYALPMALLGLSLLADFPVGAQLAAIWLAHIGADRMFGFGLKYPTHFKDTHMQRL